MSTTVKNKTKATAAKTTKAVQTKSAAPANETISVAAAVNERIDSSLIDFSPFNYRKYYLEQALNDFAADLLLHDIIHPVTVREVIKGRYELVVGERRIRGAVIAGITTIPVIIKELTDEQVIELQLAENIQRENPHPMNEAQGIGQLLATGTSVEEIHLRLGKSKQFVHSRIKLLSLIEPLREIFTADAMTIKQALELAVLSDASQQDFYQNKCENWQEKPGFKLGDLQWALEVYKANLRYAPFDTTDETLLPNIGACTGCPFNSANLGQLFPDMAKTAVCDNKQCYQRKCAASKLRELQEVFTHQPEALLFDIHPSEETYALLESIPGAMQMPQFLISQVDHCERPVEPRKDAFIRDAEDTDKDYEDYDEAEDVDDENYHSYYNLNEAGEVDGNSDAVKVEEPVFDEEAYQEALAEYRIEADDFDNQLANGNLKPAVHFSRSGIMLVYFSERTIESVVRAANGNPVTAKEVKEAEKEGTATVELYEGEIARLHKREARAKEIDSEKFHLDLHACFADFVKEETEAPLTAADHATAKLIIFNTLGYSQKKDLLAALGVDHPDYTEAYRITLFDAFATISDKDYMYLIRRALQGRSDAKLPNSAEAYFLLQLSRQAGVDVDGLKNQYALKAAQRESVMDTKIYEVNKKIEVLKKTIEVLI